MQKFLVVSCLLLLAGCAPDAPVNASNNADQAIALGKQTFLDTQEILQAQQAHTPNMLASGKMQVALEKLPMGALNANPSLPFAIDSQPVQKYAQAYNISAKQAQHALVLAMGSNEALSAVLDQLGTHYKSHHLQDGADFRLVIYTDDKFLPQSFEYILKDFGAGLALPVDIAPMQNTSKQGVASP